MINVVKNEIKNIVLYVLLLLFTLNTFLLPMASAATCEPTDPPLGIPTWYKYLDGEDSAGKCTPIFNGFEDLLPIGFAILEIGLFLAGIVAVIMIFVGAFKYIISIGEPDRAAGAQKTVINAVIGLGIAIVSIRVVSFVAGIFL